MRILSFIPTLAALVTAVAGAALPAGDKCGSGIPCSPLQYAAKRDLSELDIRGLTNAERLRRGLPPRSPISRRGTPVRRAGPSSVPQTISHRGVIQVIDPSNNAVLGYISKNSVKRAQLRQEPGIDNALIVTFNTDSTGSGNNLNLAMTNSDTHFSFLGLVQGISNKDSVLASGSFEYAVLAGVASPGTGPGSKPSNVGSSYTSAYETMRTAESAIWTFDSAPRTLTPHWVNPDGSLPTVQSFTDSKGALYVAGDMNAFKSQYKSAATVVTFKFVPS